MNRVDKGSLDPAMLEQPVTEREALLYDHFVAQYLIDYNAVRACQRLGFLPHFALDKAKEFMEHGYVQRKLAESTRKVIPKPSEEDRADTLANLRELMLTGSGPSRIAATKIYMQAQGYLKEENGEEAQQEALITALQSFARSIPE